MMRNISASIKTFFTDEGGITAIEYGLIAALVGLALMAGATTLGDKLSASFSYIATLMKVS
ncbi:Flp family type IVb pilin [Massilia sp. R2A-15]|uniref:Flp family type IVb pilin n=1 Tax=Massilia sp. R2A-15 TaxID=3064278 RepID=UPI002804780F|nr:Flp family type IVb pilin [Massilia sp. R2A-15]